MFQLINEAYQCLGDVKTRAWYDSHRDKILRGQDASNPENFNDEDEVYLTKSKLTKYFKSSSYTF